MFRSEERREDEGNVKNLYSRIELNGMKDMLEIARYTSEIVLVESG